MTPAAFTGAWQRQGLAIDDGPQEEPGAVVWIQVGASYADIRTPLAPGLLSGPGAFAGTTTYLGDHLTWHHEIDCPPLPANEPAPHDVGHITWVGGDIIERGSFTVDGVTTSYEERWCPMPGAAEGAATVLTPVVGEGIAVRSGCQLVAVMAAEPSHAQGWAALHLHLVDDEWSIVTQLGDAARAQEAHHTLAQALGASAPEPLPTQNPTMKWNVNVANTLSS